jgi:hypothetical protein
MTQHTWRQLSHYSQVVAQGVRPNKAQVVAEGVHANKARIEEIRPVQEQQFRLGARGLFLG